MQLPPLKGQCHKIFECCLIHRGVVTQRCIKHIHIGGVHRQVALMNYYQIPRCMIRHGMVTWRCIFYTPWNGDSVVNDTPPSKWLLVLWKPASHFTVCYRKKFVVILICRLSIWNFVQIVHYYMAYWLIDSIKIEAGGPMEQMNFWE